ncbi:MAG: hypothetical protein V3V11_00650, partial [Vicinamibacteria bacterium]
HQWRALADRGIGDTNAVLGGAETDFLFHWNSLSLPQGDWGGKPRGRPASLVRFTLRAFWRSH